MIELLGSLGSAIFDVEDQSLRDLEGIQDHATLMLSWHWEEDCDGMREAESKLELSEIQQGAGNATDRKGQNMASRDAQEFRKW
ncbi:unnamed protein product [Penicillium manginii]